MVDTIFFFLLVFWEMIVICHAAYDEQHHSSSKKYSSFDQLIMILAQINPTTMNTQKQLHYTCRKAETNFPLYTHKVNAALSSWYSRAKCKRVVVSQEPEPIFFTIAKVGMANYFFICYGKNFPFELPLTITEVKALSFQSLKSHY